ncbi:uncharacterized protein LOC110978636 isoform X2 [Acanthaster planci]|uniref:Uncharacterized protein LOC110978636 isoform X2 n=1 Tax=Acanthaster planci TaxID=133434 RepID=A0A8B7YA89_ACAPL|nr:uncharacterized protein LOC110978636 isoform X2 [Acanthaster planci]
MELSSSKLTACVITVLQLLRVVTSNRILLSCSFETTCGLSYTAKSQFYWSRVSGATPNQYTGPSNDHTFGNSYGKYIYAPSSRNEYDFGRRSTLYSPAYRLTSGKGRLEFYYHMWDGLRPDDMGSLSVYVCGDDSPLWIRRQNQDNRWRWTGLLEFSCDQQFRVFFVASRGKYQSDIAIDDLIITDIFDDPTTPIITTVPPTTTPTITTAPATTTPSIIAPAQRTTPNPPPSTKPTTVASTAVTPTTVAETPQPQSTPGPTATPSTVSAAGTPASTGAPRTAPSATDVQTEGPPTTVANKETSSSIRKADIQTSSASNNFSTISVSVGPNLQSGSSSPSFIGPIVVVCVALLFVGLTLCLAMKRKKRCKNTTLSNTDKEVKYTVENPSYGGVNSIAVTGDSRQPNSYSYQELMRSQSGCEDGEREGKYNTVDGGDAGLMGWQGHQEDREEAGAPKRRGESVLYAAIPDQGGANEYSYAYPNPGGSRGGLSSAGRGVGPRMATPGRAQWDLEEREYAAVSDPVNKPGHDDGGAAGAYGMVDNQFYIPFKE